MDIKQFLSDYSEAYDQHESISASRLREHAEYLDGLADSHKKNKKLKRISENLKDYAHFIAHLRRKASQKPTSMWISTNQPEKTLDT